MIKCFISASFWLASSLPEWVSLRQFEYGLICAKCKGFLCMTGNCFQVLGRRPFQGAKNCLGNGSRRCFRHVSNISGFRNDPHQYEGD